MTNKGIPKIPLFDPFSQKMSCPLFGVPTVSYWNYTSPFQDKGKNRRSHPYTYRGYPCHRFAATAFLRLVDRFSLPYRQITRMKRTRPYR